MSKRTVFTTLTPLPDGITRETVIDTLHSHTEMIDLNPLVIDRHPVRAPKVATPEEFHCIWYQITDRVQYVPGGLVKGKVSYHACFHDLPIGLQTHCYAPMGLDIKAKWSLGGTLPHEPAQPVELGLGAPKRGLWLKEEVDMRCNVFMVSFVKKTLKKAHATLVERLLEKANLVEAQLHNNRVSSLTDMYSAKSTHTGSASMDSRSSISGGLLSPRLPTTPYQTYQGGSGGSQGVDPAYQRANPYNNPNIPELQLQAPPQHHAELGTGGDKTPVAVELDGGAQWNNTNTPMDQKIDRVIDMYHR